jgi:hypothetical protein
MLEARAAIYAQPRRPSPSGGPCEAKGGAYSRMDLTVRTATRHKSIRITWSDKTSVQVGFAARSAAKSQVQVQHAKLPDRQASTRMKQFWAERLGAIGEVLAPAS